MRISRFLSAVSLIVSAPCILSGQNPASAAGSAPSSSLQRHVVAAREGMRGMMMPDAASMLLAHTGDLQLSDAQVTRLAAIARRAEVRQRALHARMDSAMTAMRSADGDGGDGAARPAMALDGRGGMMRGAMMMRMAMPSAADRKAQHEDDREALSVPTADQLATAWEMMAMRHR